MFKNLIRNFLFPNQSKDRISDLTEDADFMAIYEKCRPYTLTNIQRMHALYAAVKYAVQNNIPGDFVECGVYKGGSVMMMAYVLEALNHRSRKIYLYDTFSGMAQPSSLDVTYANRAANEMFEQHQEPGFNRWCYSSLEETQKNVMQTGYPEENLIFVKGKVEDTIPETSPELISILRLDTDFYESTYHELTHLYPRLSPRGVFIIDDYGHWKGARKAVDSYFEERGINLLLNRIDYTGRIGLKI